MSRRVLLIVNRFARQGEAAHSDALAQLSSHGFEVIDGSPRDGESINERIRELAAGVEVIVIGGGDGTLNSAAVALMKSHKPLAILPLGTANDLARTLNLPSDIAGVCQLIADGKTRRIDVGRVNDQHFFNVASVGLSVSLTDGMSKERKARFGVFAYLIASVEAVWRWRPFRADITVDGVTHHTKTVQVTIGNGVHYGGGLTVAADAAIDDQRLDVLSLEVRGWWELIPLLPALLNGTLAGSPRVKVYRGKRVELRTHKPKRVNTDGELTTQTPARFEVLPRAVEVFAPEPLPRVVPPSPPVTQTLIADRPLRGTLRYALLAGCGLLCFLVIAAVVKAGGTPLDEQFLRGARAPEDPAVLVGPRWFTIAMRDVTALGGYTALTLLTLGVAGYLAARRRWVAVAVVLLAGVGGGAVCDGMKLLFARTRPAVTPHLDEVSTSSFPSSHAAASAAVYLTLAAVAASRSSRRAVRAYLVCAAGLLVLLIGVSRVFLGVHYPTDVLGGWALGLTWAALCGLVVRWFRRRQSW
jgi:diacylglycerol kinase (ATP)